jgi:hypothetical protein
MNTKKTKELAMQSTRMYHVNAKERSIILRRIEYLEQKIVQTGAGAGLYIAERNALAKLVRVVDQLGHWDANDMSVKPLPDTKEY